MPATRDPSMLPAKRFDESHQSFMNRCMSDPNMQTAYPEPAQRAALCLHQSGMRPKVGGSRDNSEYNYRRSRLEYMEYHGLDSQYPDLRHTEVAKLPDRRPDETPGLFQTRCMSDPAMIKEYPDLKERLAVCYRRSGERPKVGGEADDDLECKQPQNIRLNGTVNFTWE